MPHCNAACVDRPPLRPVDDRPVDYQLERATSADHCGPCAPSDCLADGLTDRVWLPEDTAEDPVPAILDFIPLLLRRPDGRAGREDVRLAGGAGVRLRPLRRAGTGNSEGIIEDEYTQEQRDDIEVSEWQATQAWCAGAVGMTGISWGGLNAMQVAARRAGHGVPGAL